MFDIYSLGVVLFQLLAGYLPYEADSAVAVGIKHLTAPIPLLPAGLEIFQPIINHCLSKEPQHRYQKAADLIAALDAISDDQLQDIESKAKVFKQAGANPDAATQMSDVPVAPVTPANKRKMPDLVFPTKRVTAEEDVPETKSNSRRNILLLLLISSMAWAGYEKQKELGDFWGYKALPKIVEVFPNLFPESYLKYWADQLNQKQANQEKATETTTTVSTQVIPAQSNQTSLESGATTSDIAQPEASAIEETPAVEKELTRDEKIEQLKKVLFE